MILLTVLYAWQWTTTAALAGDRTTLRWLSFDKGVMEAQQTGKKILVDVYTTWCGWCKKMDADTYNNGSVASYLQGHYVLVRINAESATQLKYRGQNYSEQDFARAFGVDGYPTTLFLKSNGDPITKFAGYADASQFRDIIAYIAEDHYLAKKFDEYMKGKKN